ncbi:flavin reductase family protein [Psychroserpens sp.]|uniref:flavin reductase family protein n=1 Tax=Psychroserpens sp. TaxID=2020870 RepID=UPI001B0C5D9A|nr:flavin reductase family protein [Psychroserpens sp.]MBO6607543.1 flavin reductase family protein [Psychroserpens sp.]MBO6631846.1 flavin reductase family protein [Psychroserpens sp.]MBO6655203.1 flavin reductase family protein [Psychroserpens sp.]MBO6683207.1 flavin reductase family protein [Psychroserpens sp.]MBO6749771.1 flavin reductase family protein [Psychroserpens sp.]
MTYISNEQLDNFHHIYRINLINSCSGYKSANLLGSVSKEGIENVAVFSSVTHIGSNPPMLGFFLRPTTVLRNTYENIKTTGVYTINHIHEAILEDAHHTSAKYDANISEFDKTNLHPEYKNDFQAPFVKGAPVQLAMEYVEEYEIKANNTILLIGKITGLYVDEDLLEDDGFINLSKAKVSAINGLDGYAIPELKTRFGYQRPK